MKYQTWLESVTPKAVGVTWVEEAEKPQRGGKDGV